MSERTVRRVVTGTINGLFPRCPRRSRSTGHGLAASRVRVAPSLGVSTIHPATRPGRNSKVHWRTFHHPVVFATTSTPSPAALPNLGEIWLELDAEGVHLREGDCVVQNGTRHAWRNKGDRPCTMAVVLVGAGAR